MQLTNLRRDQIASLLGLTLIILTISVAGAGYFTYLNLAKIVSQLETDNKPNKNLLLYKETLVALTGMENQVEFYQLTEENIYLENYNAYTEQVSNYLDSINKINQSDEDLLVFNDSLAHLIDRKTELLNRLLRLTPEATGNDLTSLEQKVDRIPEIIKENTKTSVATEVRTSTDQPSDTTLEVSEDYKEEKEEVGWLKKLFSGTKKKEKEPGSAPINTPEQTTTPQVDMASAQKTKDSLLAVKANEYKAELSREIKKIKTDSENALKEMKSREMELETSHFETQNRIMDLITYLESRESLKLELNTLQAKELTSRTNQQILTFTILGTLLLLTSLIILLNYYTKSIKYQELLEESKKSTETLAKAKERFFANMSHELRTPMNAISGFTKILLKSPLNEDQREQLEIINKSSEHLLRLLNDVLDFSKLQAEKLQLETMPFQLKEVFLDTLKLLNESALKKGIHLTHQLDDLPEAVIGDPHRLRQILTNLISNAIKYTNEGEVKLMVSSKKQKEGVVVTTKVSDTGVGISKAQQFRLFQEFQQANQSSFSKGTGLGLAITKRLVLLHDQGKIDLKSSEGKGTEVTFSLGYPLSIEPVASPTIPERLLDLGKLRVLIADDEPFNIKLLETLLDDENISYHKAMDGEEAYQLLLEHTYDIGLLDLKMPKKDGWEVVKLIREEKGPNQETPFIALTATISKEEKERSTHSGFNHILKKPFDEKELFDLISEYTKEPLESKNNQIDLSMLQTMGDRSFVEEMVQTFIDSAEGGMLTIQQNLLDKNYDQMALTAHRIVAPARHFKANKLVKMLKDLEKRAERKDPTISEETIRNIGDQLAMTCQSLRTSLDQETTK